MEFKLKFEPTNIDQIDEIEYQDYQSMKDHLKYLPNNIIATHKLNTTTYLDAGSHGRIYNTKLTNTCTGDVKDGIIKISFDTNIELFKQETLIQALISQYSAKDTIFILPCVVKYKSLEIEHKAPGSRFAVTNSYANAIANIQEKGLFDLSTAYHKLLEHMILNTSKPRDELLFSYTKSIEYVFKNVLKAFNDVQVLFNSRGYMISHADCHFGNIMVDNTYNAKLMDFGYVKITPISTTPQRMIYQKKSKIFPDVNNAEYTVIYNSFRKNLLGIQEEVKLTADRNITITDNNLLYNYIFEEKDLLQKFDGSNFLLTGEDYSMLLYFYSLQYLSLIEFYLLYAEPKTLPSVPLHYKVKFKNIDELSHLVHQKDILGENLMSDTYKVSDDIETALTDVEKKDIDELARHIVSYLKNIFIHMPLVKVIAKFHVRNDLDVLILNERYIYIYKYILLFVNYLFGYKLYVNYCEKILRSSETDDVKEKQMSDAIIHIMIRFMLFSVLSTFDNFNTLHLIGIVPIRHISHYINLLNSI
jgi:hypothetical protein